jgi:hypothetical protein
MQSHQCSSPTVLVLWGYGLKVWAEGIKAARALENERIGLYTLFTIAVP